jgi:hypothetical protein
MTAAISPSIDNRGSYKWAAAGDINAFFGLMLDNVVNLAVLAGILVFGFGFPSTLVYTRMFPGTALGVMFGDIVYTVMAIRLAKRTGRNDVTAMPLGLDAPSTIGMALTVLGPAFLAAKARMPDAEAAVLAWQVGMATMVMMGVFKLIMSFFGDRVRRAIPEAGLLGSIGGVGIALLGTLQLAEIYGEPVVGMLALGVIIYALVAKIKLRAACPRSSRVWSSAQPSTTCSAPWVVAASRRRAGRELPDRVSSSVIGLLARDVDCGARVSPVGVAVRDSHRDRRHQCHGERTIRGRRLQHARHSVDRGRRDVARRRLWRRKPVDAIHRTPGI